MNQEIIDEQTAIAAAQWWANELRDASTGKLNADAEATLERFPCRSRPTPATPKQIQDFSDHLVALIIKKQPRVLKTDYGPQAELYEAFDAAGIEHGLGQLPVKTAMRFSDRTVKKGYQGQVEKF